MVHQKAYCDENYTIDNQRVLLYKIINWWYDCLPEEANRLCHSRIRYENRGNAHIQYNESEKKLTVGIRGGFAELMSVIKQCDGCDGPSSFECTRLNPAYFGKGHAVMISKSMLDQQAFAILNVQREQVRLLRDIKHHIVLVVEGVIGGLMSGKIALHQGGDMIKTCPKPELLEDGHLPITLTLFNAKTNEMLATYAAVYNKREGNNRQ